MCHVHKELRGRFAIPFLYGPDRNPKRRLHHTRPVLDPLLTKLARFFDIRVELRRKPPHSTFLGSSDVLRRDVRFRALVWFEVFCLRPGTWS